MPETISRRRRCRRRRCRGTAVLRGDLGVPWQVAPAMPQLKFRMGTTSLPNETVGVVRSAQDSYSTQASPPASVIPPSVPGRGILRRAGGGRQSTHTAATPVKKRCMAGEASRPDPPCSTAVRYVSVSSAGRGGGGGPGRSRGRGGRRTRRAPPSRPSRRVAWTSRSS